MKPHSHPLPRRRFPQNRLASVLGVLAGFMVPLTATAWSRTGHMISAVIAVDELGQSDSAVINKLAGLIWQHPDRSAFELAAEGTRGRERAMRLLMECARWPDDSRNTMYDHPTWHYASRPVIRPDTPRPPAPSHVSGQAIEALELNLRVAANPGAPAAERAVAVCWVMHVAADMHQPLHAADLYSAHYAEGDAGGNKQYVSDPATNESLTLHWYWDSLVKAPVDPVRVVARARELAARHPRTSLPELKQYRARDFAGWSFGESYPLAAAQAYSPVLPQGGTSEKPVALPAGYAATAEAIGERQMALAGYRLTDLLREIARERQGNAN